MKKYRYISSLLVILLFVSSCGDFLDVNEDPNNPEVVSEQILLTGILANFSYEIIGGFPTRVTNTWIKQTTYNAVLPHYDNYQLTENDVDNLWTYYSYGQVMKNCQLLIDKGEANGTLNYAAIARIILAWNLSIVTDLYGNVPYSQALQLDEFPKPIYDTQEQVYESIQGLLDQAIQDIENNVAIVNPGVDDFIFKGEMKKWEKLAYTLKARFYLRLTYAPGYNRVTQADLALAALGNGMEVLPDDARYPYKAEAGQENPWFQYTIDGKWNTDTQISNSYITLLKDLKDPRIHSQAGLVDDEYEGHENGEEAGAAVSPIGEFYSAADAPVDFISAIEAKFIAAEAYFLKEQPILAATSLKDGITLSIDKQTPAIIKGALEYGITEDSIKLQIIDYINVNSVLPADKKEAYAHIMTQKHIANFLQFETYNDWRRTGYPERKVIAEPFTSITTIPLRFPYPSSELQYNADNVNAEDLPIGFRALGGRVWWNTSDCDICGAKE